MENTILPTTSSQPTYEELKPNQKHHIGRLPVGSQPTYEELKRSSGRYPLGIYYRSQPTYEELKQKAAIDAGQTIGEFPAYL